MTQITEASAFGDYIRRVRKEQRLTQPDLALIAGVGVRFIVDLEAGKETCQIGLSLRVVQALGIGLEMRHEGLEAAEENDDDLVVDFDEPEGMKP